MGEVLHCSAGGLDANFLFQKGFFSSPLFRERETWAPVYPGQVRQIQSQYPIELKMSLTSEHGDFMFLILTPELLIHLPSKLAPVGLSLICSHICSFIVRVVTPLAQIPAFKSLPPPSNPLTPLKCVQTKPVISLTPTPRRIPTPPLKWVLLTCSQGTPSFCVT